MTVMPPDIQWYIARDGKQYGPLSDSEMGLFVKGGHLRPTDLVWRPGFSDWVQATVAFPPPAAAAPAPIAPPVAAPTRPQPAQPAPAAAQSGPHQGPQPAHQQPMASQPAHPAQPAPLAQPAPYAQPAPLAHPAPSGQPARPTSPIAAQMAGGSPVARGEPAALQPAPAQPAPAQPVPAQPAGFASAPAAPSAIDAARAARGRSAGPEADPATAGRRAEPGGRAVIAVEPGFPGDEDEEPKRGSLAARLVRIAAVLAVVGGLGYGAYVKRNDIKAMATAMVASGGKSGDPALPAFVVPQGPADSIDKGLQRTELWGLLKREFPDWYNERVTEAARLVAEKKPEPALTKHVVEALVALRRKHANDALAAPSPRLVGIANAFLGNLKSISEVSTSTCYSFISQGEASAAVIEMLQKPATHAGLQSQVTAIFEAVAAGRKSPVKHAAPEKSDYDLLAQQLTKLGWSQADLQLFADPRALARTSHDRVCKMVQDWFSAHLAVTDRAAQERLLIETLRPVVAG